MFDYDLFFPVPSTVYHAVCYNKFTIYRDGAANIKGKLLSRDYNIKV